MISRQRPAPSKYPMQRNHCVTSITHWPGFGRPSFTRIGSVCETTFITDAPAVLVEQCFKLATSEPRALSIDQAMHGPGRTHPSRGTLLRFSFQSLNEMHGAARLGKAAR